MHAALWQRKVESDGGSARLSRKHTCNLVHGQLPDETEHEHEPTSSELGSALLQFSCQAPSVRSLFARVVGRSGKGRSRTDLGSRSRSQVAIGFEKVCKVDLARKQSSLLAL
jgi:hypothetical protein